MTYFLLGGMRVSLDDLDEMNQYDLELLLNFVQLGGVDLNRFNKLGGSKCPTPEKSVGQQLLTKASATKIVQILRKLDQGFCLKVAKNACSVGDNVRNMLEPLDRISQLKKMKKNLGGKECMRAPISQLFYENVAPLLDEFTKIAVANENLKKTQHTSLNVVRHGGALKIDYTKTYSRGNIYRYVPFAFEVIDNDQVLVNLFLIEHPSPRGMVASLRYGTPFFKETAKYRQQCDMIRNYVGNRRLIVVSLIDICNSALCHLAGNKVKETSIITNEIYEYNMPHICFLPLSVNNNVNIPNDMSTFKKTPKLQTAVEDFVGRLYQWVVSASQNSVEIRTLAQWFPFFRQNVLTNMPPAGWKRGRTVLTVNGEKVALHNEEYRLMVVCYLSLLVYMLSIAGDKDYCLAYHCKSGQDRTGTFYAINQMVNEITSQHFDQVVASLKNGMAFEDLYDKFYSTAGPNKSEAYDILSRYLAFSYVVTYTSTGFPGIKWNLGASTLGQSTENRFPYLLVRSATEARLFEGASMLRGA